MSHTIESWRQVWREGIAPQYDAAEPSALRDALRLDDPRLVQGRTVVCPGGATFPWSPVSGCCAMSLPGLIVGTFSDRSDGWEYFLDKFDAAVGALGNDRPRACLFTRWFDETPREEARTLLLAEVERSLGLLAHTPPSTKEFQP